MAGIGGSVRPPRLTLDNGAYVYRRKAESMFSVMFEVQPHPDEIDGYL